MKLRTPLAWLAATATALGLTAMPVANAQETGEVTTNANFNMTCQINLPLGQSTNTSVDGGVDIAVTAPEQVTVGEEFNVTFELDPIDLDLGGASDFGDLQEASRLKLDFARPAGTELIGYDISGGNLNLAGAQVITVNDAGQPDPNGQVLRLTDAGHHTTGNGPNSGTGNHGGVGVDLRGASTINLDFPAITMTLRATEAGTADIGWRTAGDAGSLGNDANFLTALASAEIQVLFFRDTIWADAQCSPRHTGSGNLDPRASQLASVEIIEAQETTTILTGPEGILIGEPAEFTATVNPNIPGTVEFSRGEQVLGEAPVNPDTGEATTELTFTEVSEEPLRATFTPQQNIYSPSSAEMALSFGVYDTDLELDAPHAIYLNEPAQFTATVDPNIAGTVEFSHGEQSIEAQVNTDTGEAIGELIFDEEPTEPVTATFTPAQAGYASSTTSIAVSIELRDTTLQLSAPQAIFLAEPAQFTATVDPNIPGIVEFRHGEQSVEEEVDPASGQAIGELTFTEEPTEPVTAIFTPAQAGYASSQIELPVSTETRGTAVELDTPAEIYLGEAAEFRATVAPNIAGTVEFRYGEEVVSAEVDPETGIAITTLTFHDATVDNVRATFVPEAPAYTGSTISAPITVLNHETALSIEAPPAIYLNEPAEFTATVEPSVAGTVEFSYGEETATADVDPATGQASAELSFSDASINSVAARFTPQDPGHEESTAAIDIFVETRVAELRLGAPTEVTIGEPTTITATLPEGAQGTVSFNAAGEEQTIEVIDGTATAEFSFAEAGPAFIDVTFTPEPGSSYGAATEQLEITVAAEEAPAPAGFVGAILGLLGTLGLSPQILSWLENLLGGLASLSV